MDEARANEPLGRSLELADGDLVFAGGGLALVAGRDNLRQGLETMIATPTGSDIFNVVVGFDLGTILVQPLSPPLVRELIRLNVVKSLALDDRVQEVREVVFDDDPRFFELVPDADPEASRKRRRRERRWRAAVVVTLAEEGATRLTLELEGAGL